ncbi:MAG: ATP-binding protein [Gemmatimonadales bacterium]|nr:ATP-binding protein [Gemmatimonadales bacterium]
MTLLGRVVATELRPSTPHQFSFWTAPHAPLGIGSIVRVDGDERVVYGVVTEAFAYSDLARPLDAVIGADGDPGREDDAPTSRPEIRLWTAAVLRQLPEEPLQPVPFGGVAAASDADVRVALRMDAYMQPDKSTGLPIGVYAAGGLSAPVFLDADFLLGPEAAHLNITGVSGLATKTSAVTFMLSSIFQTFPAEKGSVAAVCFNVKGPDLCFLDQPAPLGDADLALWRRLGLEPAPFPDMTLYAPFKADGVNLNTLRSNAALADTVQPLVWGLREILDYAEVVLNRDDVDAKADALIDFLAERVVGRQFEALELRGAPFEVLSFADLEEFFRAIFDHLETSRGGEVWRTHHVATIRKIRNRLGNIATRSKGLVTDDGVANDLPWGAFRDRSLTVIDVAGVDPLAQDLVFARVISRLREHLERRDLGVDHVVVFVDELNKYAPADGPDTYVRKMLLDLSERGRYLGLVLFSAQQFRSQVIRRVTGNAGTTIYGRMDTDELALPAYSTLSPAVKAKLAALPKGELLLRHPHFTQPVFVRFPRPAALSGREGVERFPPSPDLPFAEAVVQRLRALTPGIIADQVRAVIDGRPEAEVRRALSATVRRRPDDPFAFFRAWVRRTIPSESPEPRRGIAPLASDDDDPFAPY